MSVQQLSPADFNGARVIDWFGPASNAGDPADLNPNAYADAAHQRAVTLTRAAPAQSVTVSICSALGLRANLQAGTGLLLATNIVAAPLQMRWSAGVRSVGAFVVAQAAFDTPFNATMWVWLAGAKAWHSVSQQGVTGDIWLQAGDTVAPFVAAQAPAGDAITAVCFDAVHPSAELFSPLGIGRLYFREA